jgi:hypothetical protein
MKASVRLELQQAEMRSRLRLDRRQRSPETSSLEPAGLRRAIAALVLAYGRGWSAADIATFWMASGSGLVPVRGGQTATMI